MKILLISSLLLLLSALSCKSGQKPGGAATLSMREVASGIRCGISEPREVLITDAAAWEALWQEVGSRSIPPPALPVVDFSRETVIACFSGAKSTGGHGIAIEGITLSPEGYRVAVTKISPGKTCMVTEAFTYPYQIVAVAGTAARAATFTTTTQLKDCP